MQFRDLPLPVIQALEHLGRQAARDGIHLFVFGSFARGDAQPTSDLDLGYEIVANEAGSALRRLTEAVGRLPTIRPVELVDFGTATPAFRDLARQRSIDLYHDD